MSVVTENVSARSHARAASLTAATEADMSREFMFENEFAICWKTTVLPNVPLKMHRHDRARTIVALQGGVLKRIDEAVSYTHLTLPTIYSV